MNTVNVSRGTGWIRVILAVACFGAVGWGVYLLWKYHDTAYANLSHVLVYVHPAVYLVTFLAAVVGIISGVVGIRSPGKAPGWILNVALVVLLALTLWACASVQTGIATLD